MARRHYDEAFKQEAVRLVREQGLPLKRVAQDLGVDPATLRSWRQQRDPDAGQPISVTSRAQYEAELRRLQKENHELRLQREILKKATAFFAAQQP